MSARFPLCGRCGERVSVVTGMPLLVEDRGGVAVVGVDMSELADIDSYFDLACGCEGSPEVDDAGRDQLHRLLSMIGRDVRLLAAVDLPEEVPAD